jgi:hypothetical protein
MSISNPSVWELELIEREVEHLILHLNWFFLQPKFYGLSEVAEEQKQ